MINRIDLEEREKQNLAPYAMYSQESRGRKYPEEEDALRTSFQRDRDRIVHTNAFRRLADKTQVRSQPREDLYRSRLTHSLEVAQIGRSLARTLGCNEDLVEAICLVHDLGHPPFGHSGEEALDSVMNEVGGFNHQDYTYKLVTDLELRRPGLRGLNLTYEVREGIRKHRPSFEPWEVLEYHPQERATLESQIANIADEIAYYSSDVDDFLRSRLGEKLCQSFHGLADLGFFKRLRNQPEIADLEHLDLGQTVNRKKLISALVTFQVVDCLKVTCFNLKEARVSSVDAVRAQSENLADNSVEVHLMKRELRDFLFPNYFEQEEVRRWIEEGVEVLVGVFKAYLDGPLERITDLPTWHGAGGRREKAVGDYLAGMTENFLYRTAVGIGVIDFLPDWYRGPPS